MKVSLSFLNLSFFFIMHSYGNIIDTTSSSDTTSFEKKYRKFKIALDYSSENTFKGRKNTTNIPILSPFFKYIGKSGFFTQVSLVDVPTGKIKKVFDELDAGAGWIFNFSDQWDGSISYMHYFYDSGVARLKSAVKSDLNTSVGFDWDILYSQLLFDINADNPKNSNKGKAIPKHTKDYTLTFANTHYFYFYFKEGRKLTASPEADVLLGTQNFYAAYKGKLDATAHTKYQKQVTTFTLTAYILYLNVNYKIKKFAVGLTPSYTIPQNVPEGESSTPFFVMSGRVSYTFRSN